ncbi:high mobility group box domain-containing protein [Blyttiomyces helicus]|uniref:High mobility group box domain-containing protein n=1 Tax=Blyttiomyces helicus TaxID=388810 RepID=A0A4P9WIS4_9FUNG|nr:high mobility group box domain-containing protein [Blyttiomyces helicus]|eukprot:RKO91925.1 high mobility group box domain-containing protein [Blyttiomyces helicus]
MHEVTAASPAPAKKAKLTKKDNENVPPKDPRKPKKDPKPKDPAAPKKEPKPVAPKKDAKPEDPAAPLKKKAASKIKIKKVDGMPKRPACAFISFCNEKRPRFKTENPEAAFGEIQKALGVMWKEASAEEKKIHNDLYKSKMATWTLACAAHLASASPIVPTAAATASEEDLDLDAEGDTDPECTPPQVQHQQLLTTQLRRAQSYDLVSKIQSLARSPSLVVACKSDEDRMEEDEEEQVLPDMEA